MVDLGAVDLVGGAVQAAETVVGVLIAGRVVAVRAGTLVGLGETLPRAAAVRRSIRIGRRSTAGRIIGPLCGS